MENKWGFLSKIALITQIGISMALPVIVCIWLGGVIDQWLGTSILFLIIFTILGVGASFRNLYILAKQEVKPKEETKTNDK